MSAPLQPGDRVRYATAFMQNMGTHMGAAPLRTGTFASYWDKDPKYARVKWDNFDAQWHARQNGQDYADDAVANGQLVLAVNIERLSAIDAWIDEIKRSSAFTLPEKGNFLR